VATSAVPADEVGAASGVSNMARYVGASVMVAVAAALYASASAGVAEPTADTLATGFVYASVSLAIVSAAGIGLAVLAATHRPRRPRGVDYAAAAAASAHTVPADDEDRLPAGPA
jgi:hypothetical protein